MSPPTCQKCGGDIAGWLCQNCPAEFRENDDGVLIFDVEAPAEAGEDFRAQVVKLLDELIAHIVAIGPDKPDLNTPMLRRVWREVFADLIDALRAQPQARAWGWDYEICTGCSASLKLSCCPDRRMVTVRDLVDAYDAQRKPPAREDAQPVALSLDGAPRDGTMLRLRVRYEAANQDEAWTPLEDSEESWTIGFNNFDNTGDDRWQFVGWDWSQDHLLEATGGVVIGWLPFHTRPAPDALRVAVEALTAAMRVMTRIAATSSANLDQAITNIAEMREAALHGADAAAQALAALQAEQGAK